MENYPISIYVSQHYELIVEDTLEGVRETIQIKKGDKIVASLGLSRKYKYFNMLQAKIKAKIKAQYEEAF